MRNQKGQTLIEVVVAVAILVMALTVMVAAVTKAVANNRLSKERAIATRLAQEGIDWIRNLRLSAGSWNGFMDLMPAGAEVYCDNNSGGMITVMTLPAALGASPDACSTIFERSNSNYSRAVEIKPDLLNDKVEVTTYVYWFGGRADRESVQAKTILKKAL